MKEIQPHPKEKDEILWAKRAHLSSLLTYVFAITPFLSLQGGALVPLIFQIYILFSKRKSDYVFEQATEAGYFQLLLAGMFWSIPEIFPYSNSLDSFNPAKLLQFLSYVGIGIFHIITLGWSVISISYGKPYNHFLSPFKSIFQSLIAKKIEKKLVKSQLDDLSKKMYYDVKEKIEKKFDSFSILRNKNLSLAPKLDKMNLSLSKLISTLKNDPNELINSRHFLIYILDSLCAILQKYFELNQIEKKDETIQNSLKKVPPILDSIENSIDKYQQKLMEKTVMQLDAEIEVMKKSIDSDFFR
jgi:5-bromo-4-chloroindolyl phosphate hydrolysis protein